MRIEGASLLLGAILSRFKNGIQIVMMPCGSGLAPHALVAFLGCARSLHKSHARRIGIRSPPCRTGREVDLADSLGIDQGQYTLHSPVSDQVGALAEVVVSIVKIARTGT